MSGIAIGTEFHGIVVDGAVPQLRKNIIAFWKRHHDDPAAVSGALIALWDDDSDISPRIGITMALGLVADTVPASMEFLLDVVAPEENWRVQEALAKSFEWFCSTRGWEESLPVLDQWLHHPHHHVRRAATEGPRVWTKRPYFIDHPAAALELLGGLRTDPSSYVRKSVANALSDISKTYPDLTLEWFARWSREPAAAWVLTRACRHLMNTHAEQAKRLLAATVRRPE